MRDATDDAVEAQLTLSDEAHGLLNLAGYMEPSARKQLFCAAAMEGLIPTEEAELLIREYGLAST